MSVTETPILRLERTYDAPVEAVFDAWTNPEVLRRWWVADSSWRTPVAEVDLRVTTAANAQRLEARILGLKPHNPKARIVVTGGMNRPPMERTPGVAALYEMAKGIARELGFELGEASVGGASDANFVTPLGIPVVDGLGGVGDGGHATNEHVEVASLPVRAALIAGLIRELQSGDGVATTLDRS